MWWIIGIVVIFFTIVGFSACVASGMADDSAERDFEEFKRMLEEEKIEKKKGEEEGVSKK